VDDLSYDEIRDEEAPSAAGPLLTGLVVLLVALLGAPQVWDALHSRDFGPELVFYPVLALSLGHLALRRARS
jgi:hypothetical protein